MSLRPWRLWGAFLLLSFIGCRSQKTAFTFQPPATTTKPTASFRILPDSIPAAKTVAREVQATHALGATGSASSLNKQEASVKPAISKKASQTVAAVFKLKNRQSAALMYHETVSRQTVHFMLGLSLIVGGIVTGLLVGGWLGFGIGALIVLLGDYFLILGIGGAHAWTEVFQEFFNL